MKKYFNRETREIWIAIAVGMIAATYLLGTRVIQRSGVVGIGAEFMPTLYGTLLLIISVCQIISGVVQYRKSRAAHGRVSDKAAASGGKRSAKPIITVFILIAVCVAMMKYAGFVISGSIMTFGMCVLLTPYYVKKNYAAYTVFSTALAIATYFLFKRVLYVSLPVGAWFVG